MGSTPTDAHFGHVSVVDSCNGKAFPALILNERRNGHAQPYFDMRVYSTLVECLVEEGGDPGVAIDDALARTDGSVTRCTMPGWTWAEVPGPVPESHPFDADRLSAGERLRNMAGIVLKHTQLKYREGGKNRRHTYAADVDATARSARQLAVEVIAYLDEQ